MKPAPASLPPRLVAAGIAAIGAVSSSPSPAGGQAVDTAVVGLSRSEAVVEQRIPNLGERVEALAIRVPGQTLDMLDVVREGVALLDATLTPSVQAHRFVVESGAPVTVRYRVRGSLDRIPLFVPGGRAELTVVEGVVESVLLRITGEAAALERIETDTSMPRFERVGPALEARLSSLPSFVRLSDGGPTSFPRLADAFALVLILGASAYALRRLAPRTSGPKPEEPGGG